MTLPESPLPPWRIVAPLAATPVSRTWQVAAGEHLAVLRIDGPGARQLGLDRLAEQGVVRAAAAAGIGPSLIHADAGRGQLLTAWLPGRAYAAADLNDAGALEGAAALLRRLHATPLPGPVTDLHEAVDRYAAMAGPAEDDLASVARQHLARCLAGVTAPLCFCHNDPTPGNFIVSPCGELRLIDWEYAGLCHREFDLAGLAVGAGLSPGRAADLLTAYLGRPPTAAESARQLAWEAFSRAVGALWQAAVTRIAAAGPSGIMSTG